jgi:hypothetical protein
MKLSPRPRRWTVTLIAIVIAAALAILGQIPSSSATESDLAPLLILESPPQPCPTPPVATCTQCNVNNVAIPPCR